MISLLSKGLLRGWLQNWYNNSEGVLCCEIEKLVKMLILSGIKVINLEEGGQKYEMGRVEKEPYGFGLKLEIVISSNGNQSKLCYCMLHQSVQISCSVMFDSL